MEGQTGRYLELQLTGAETHSCVAITTGTRYFQNLTDLEKEKTEL